jgi:hypothetical protein
MKMIYCLSSCHVNEIKSVQTPWKHTGGMEV